MKFVDLFAGCGGLSLGLSSSGLTPVFAVEKNPTAFKTYKYNLIDRLEHDWPEGFDPQEMTVDSLFKSKNKGLLQSLVGNIDLVAGGPPCQGFSTLGKRDSSDPRNKLFLDYLRFVEITKPRIVLLENVAGMRSAFAKSSSSREMSKKSKSIAEVLQGKLEKLGYKVLFEDVLLASNFGVPQRRPRFILIAVREVCLKKSSEKIEANSEQILALMEQVRKDFLIEKKLPLNRPVTAGDAISDLETKSGTVEYTEAPLLGESKRKGFQQVEYSKPDTPYQKLMHGKLNGEAPNSSRLPNHRSETRKRFERIHELATRGKIKPGGNISRENLEKVGVRKHYLSLLSKEKPSLTVSTLPDDMLHYDEPRILTVRESARLQSFPDDFKFTGVYTTGGQRRQNDCPRYTQVGNAVPPLLAEFLGQFISQIEKKYLT